MEKLKLIVLEHYRNTERIRTEKEIEAEAKILCVPFNRWYCMPAGVALQFCVGSVYAWSVYNQPIDLHVDGSVTNRTPLTFMIAIGLLGFSAAVMGPWLERHGPRKAALLGSGLFFLGNISTALGIYLQWMWLIWIGYGVVGGCGIGLCYISPVSALQKWFPERRGLAAGVAVAGFGSGSIVMAKVQVWVMEWVGLSATFVILGCAYLIIMCFSALVLRTPPPNYSTENGNEKSNSVTVSVGDDAKSMSLMEALTSKDYRLLYIAFMANIVFGLVLISRLSNIVTDIFLKSKSEAATVVSINSALNLAGRLIYSTSSDILGRKNTYFILLTTQAVILSTFSTLTSSPANYYIFLGAIWLLTSCYGGGFSVIPAFLTDKFTSQNVGACHGVLLTAWSVAGIMGGIIFTLVFNAASDHDLSNPYPYNINSWWLLSVVLLGLTALIFVKPTEKDVKFTSRILKLFRCQRKSTEIN